MRVAVRITKHGDTEFYADEPVDLLLVDERTERDRVYRWSSLITSPEAIDHLIGDSRIGQIGDMPMVEARVRRYLATGEDVAIKPTLSIVRDD